MKYSSEHSGLVTDKPDPKYPMYQKIVENLEFSIKDPKQLAIIMGELQDPNSPTWKAITEEFLGKSYANFMKTVDAQKLGI